MLWWITVYAIDRKCKYEIISVGSRKLVSRQRLLLLRYAIGDACYLTAENLTATSLHASTTVSPT